jgi:drug/metabolite transporter (DMT)-like permease
MTTEVGTRPVAKARGLPDSLLAWYFVVMWGSGYLATKAGLGYAAPFTFLTLRFCFGIVCMLILVAWSRPAWPKDGRTWMHVVVAGLLMHACNLGGSHYAQYLGMSAGITALILATQPLLTALVRMRADRLFARQWTGIAIGLAGVALVVGHKIDVDAASIGSIVAVLVSLIAITVATLYQRRYCADVDLRSAGLIQFAASAVFLAPLAMGVEGFAVRWDWRLLGVIVFIVIGGSILAVNALHTLMRHGVAARVTSMLYLTPIVALFLEWVLWRVVPAPTAVVGIAVTCAGVALVTWKRRTPVPDVET